jgi:hypothetical protein
LGAALPVLDRQRTLLHSTENSLKKIVAELPGQESFFLNANLLTQQRIMLGLLDWCGYAIEARNAVNQKDFASAAKMLRKAALALESAQSGKVTSATGKWKNWYRGDKKMNIAAALELTEKLATQVQRLDSENK